MVFLFPGLTEIAPPLPTPHPFRTLPIQPPVSNTPMKVLNIHKRDIQQPISELARLFGTLATENDLMLATDKWPRMKLDKGLQIGSKGGHGPIRYTVSDYQEGRSIRFRFDMPGFNGFHQFTLTESGPGNTELSHIIDMRTTGAAVFTWALAIRWLHDAFIEDAFDKVENYFTRGHKRTEWSGWVKVLRNIMKPKQRKHTATAF